MWNFSHTDEAYQNLYANLEQQDKALLDEIYAEWEAYRKPKDSGYTRCGNFSKTAYAKALGVAKRMLRKDTLVDHIYDLAMEQAECTNGGHYAYTCPYHCDCHKISFDLLKGETTNE